jgi:hypothetical protein
MARILVLAGSGFGKSTSIGNIPELGIKGLDPATTFIISVTSKPLPFKGSGALYPSVRVDNVASFPNLVPYKRLISNNPDVIEKTFNELIGSPFKTIVLDDMNYIMQDYYMDNALRTGWDAPKKIGFDMNKIFKAIEKFEDPTQHVIVLAHGESVMSPDGRTYFKLKTTGKMVDEYVTPEGKFDITLVGISRFDSGEKKVMKEYITNENEQYSSPKSPVGMFKDIAIPNDLGLVIDKVNEYYGN